MKLTVLLTAAFAATLAAALVATALVTTGTAAPLVKLDNGKPVPSVITEWSANGKKVELTLAPDTDPGTVAAAIEASVDRVRAKVKGGKVLVLGKTADDLLPLLAGIDLDQEENDLDTLAAASLETDEVDSGSSLRAKKKADLETLLNDRQATAVGQVVSVTRGAFPQAEVRIRILSAPTGPLRRRVQKGKTLSFVPLLKRKAGAVDFEDTQTQTNLGAYFLRKGDRVKILVGQAPSGRITAQLITR